MMSQNEGPLGVKKGDRIKLIAMPKDPFPIPAGTMGTVQGWRDLGSIRPGQYQIDVEWDINRTLRLTEKDLFVVTESTKEPA